MHPSAAGSPRDTFTDPEQLRPERAAARVTESAAAEFAKLATSLERRGTAPQDVAHFLMRLLFASLQTASASCRNTCSAK